MMVIVEQLMEWNWQENPVLGENLSQRHFVRHKSRMTRPLLEPGRPRWEGNDNPPELWRFRIRWDGFGFGILAFSKLLLGCAVL
jgi:hypothetical protein